MDGRPLLVTVPTELERQNAARDVFLLVGSVLLAYAVCDNWGFPLWTWAIVPVVAVWALTGEPAGDTALIGSVASSLRHRCGMRRAHEWVLAFGRWWYLAVWPHWRDWCLLQLSSFQRRMTRWLRLENVMIRWKPWRRSSWASASRPSLFPRRER